MDILESDESALIARPKFREYAILSISNGASYIPIAFCPWCAIRLPSSLRHEFFNRLDALGIEQPDGQRPEEFKTDRWWLEDDTIGPE